jgi:formate-dependent nitrite reductase membrane component NrfD
MATMLEAVVLIVLGLLVLVMALTRPAFFWNRGRSRTYRGMIGDKGALVLYLLTAFIVLGLGIYRFVQAAS